MRRPRTLLKMLLSAAAVGFTFWAFPSLPHGGQSLARRLRGGPGGQEMSGEEVRRFSDISFGRNNATVGESAAALLDNAAIEMQNKPGLRIVIDGHADIAELPGIALRRAEVEQAYLVHARGISPERIITRRFDHRCPKDGPHGNRRVELFLLPAGHPINDIGKECGGGPQRSDPREAPRLSRFEKKDGGRLPSPKLVAQTGHAARVRAVAFSADGRTALTGSDDSTAGLWDVSAGAKLQELAGHAGAVNQVALSPDGSLALSAGDDGTARLWDSRTGVEVGRLAGHQGKVTAAAFSPDAEFVATGGEDSIVRVWRARTGGEARRFDAGYPVGLAFSPDGRHLLTADASGNVLLRDAHTAETVRRIQAHAPLTFAAFSRDGKQLLTGGDHLVQWWDAATGAGVRSMTSDPSQILSAGLSPDGRLLALGRVGAVEIWDVSGAPRLRRVGKLAGSAEALAFSPDGNSVLVGGGDSTARLLVAADGAEKKRFGGHTESINAVSLSGGDAVFGFESGLVSLWDVKAGRERRRFSMRPYAVYEAAVSPDRRLVRALGVSPEELYRTDWDGDPGTSRVWLDTGKELRVRDDEFGQNDREEAFFKRRRFYLTGDGGFVREAEPVTFVLRSADTGRRVRVFRGLSAALSADDRRVLVGHPGGRVLLHEAATGRVLRSFGAGPAGVDAVGFSPDGRLLWAIDDDGHAFVWEASSSSASPLWRHQSDARHLYFMEFSPGARRVAVESRATHMTTVSVLDASSGEELWRYEEEQHGETLTFSPDGRFALRNVDYPRYSSASARLLDASTGAVLWSTEDFGARFSPDGRSVISHLIGGGVRVREAATGREAWRFTRGRTAGALAPDGRLALVGARNGTAWLLDAGTGAEVARVFFFRGGRWAVLDPEGRYYDAHAGAGLRGLLNVVRDTSAGPPQSAAGRFVPGLLSRLSRPGKGRGGGTRGLGRLAS